MKSSNMLVTALRLPIPEGLPGQTAANCGLCGEDLPVGAPRFPLKSTASFNDWNEVSGHLACPACIACWNRPVLSGTQKVVIIPDRGAVLPMGQFGQRAWLLQNPPSEPSVWLYSSNPSPIASMHLFWRTPVTRDARQLIYLRYGNQVFLLRRQLLLDAVEACRLVVEAGHTASLEPKEGKAKGKGKAKVATRPNHPFVRLDPSFSEVQHGVLREDYVKSALAQGQGEAIRLLRRLTPGEKWALMPLLYTTQHPPTEPLPLPRENFLPKIATK